MAANTLGWSERKFEVTMKKLVGAALAAFFCYGPAQASEGWASYYKSGRLTANGEHFRPMGLTCAHRRMAFGTKLKVTNLHNGWIDRTNS